MADSPSSPEDAEEYFSASDGAQSDFSVVEDSSDAGEGTGTASRFYKPARTVLNTRTLVGGCILFKRSCVRPQATTRADHAAVWRRGWCAATDGAVSLLRRSSGGARSAPSEEKAEAQSVQL